MNGNEIVIREMTEDEIKELETEQKTVVNNAASYALTEMARAISEATTIAQVRAAAKAFLDQTEQEE